MSEVAKTSGVLSKLSIKQRITLQVLIIIFFIGIFAIGYNVWIIQNKIYNEKLSKISYITELAYKTIENYSKKAQKGLMTKKEAQEAAKEAIRAMRFDNGNYLWINNYDGVMLMHPAKPHLEGKNLKKVSDAKGFLVFEKAIELAQKKKSAFLDYHWTKPGIDKDKHFPKVSHLRGFDKWNWLIATGDYVDDIKKEVHKIIISNVLFILIICAVIVTISNFTMEQSITKPLVNIAKTSKKISEKDLTVNIPDNENKTEIGELNRSFKSSVQGIKDLISNVKSTTSELNKAFDEIAKAAEETAHGSNNISEGIVSLSQGAQKQKESVNKGLSQIKEIDNTAQVLSEKTGTTLDLAIETEKNTEYGSEQSEITLEKSQKLKNSTTNISDVINELGKLGSEIGVAVDLIKGIASQTNLLALNAAIEASRAGEHGKGFAVVADEVKKLAGQSEEAAESITSMIEEVQKKTKAAVKNMEANSFDVEENINAVKNTIDTLEKIKGASVLTRENIQYVVGDIQELTKSLEKIVAEMEEISKISEKSADNSEAISSVVEQQTANLQEISAGITSISNLANQLKQAVEIYKI